MVLIRPLFSRSKDMHLPLVDPQWETACPSFFCAGRPEHDCSFLRNENADAAGARDGGPGELVRPCPQCQKSMFLKARAVSPSKGNTQLKDCHGEDALAEPEQLHMQDDTLVHVGRLL